MKIVVAALVYLVLGTLAFDSWSQTPESKGTHIAVSGVGAPAAPTNVVIVQQGGTACQFNIGSPGCVSNSQKLQWAPSEGATYYSVSRNGSALSSGGCSGSIGKTTCTDATATNSNILSSYGTETVYQYSVQACNSNGCSAGVTPALYLFSGGPNNSCANFSGGGFGPATVNTTNGSNIITVTAIAVPPAANPMNPYQGIETGSSAFPAYSATGPQIPSTAYLLPYGTSGTTGTGGTGTYAVSRNAAATLTGTTLQAFPESCFVTQVAEPGHTYSLGTTYSGGGYMQQVTGNPGVPPYEAAVGAMSYAVVDVYPTDCTHTSRLFEMSRPGGAGNNTGDIYSNYTVTLYTNCSSSYVSGGKLTQNAWNTIKVPMTSLGEGLGTETGYTIAKWQGTGAAPASGGTTTLTIQSTTNGSASNIQIGDFMIAWVSGGTQGLQVTNVSGLPTSIVVQACPGDSVGNVNAIPSGAVIYDAQLVVQSITGAPADNGGMITGNSVPNGTFLQCTNAGQNASVGTWGIANGNNKPIPSAGSSGSPLPFSYQRISLYKPNITVTGTGAATVFWDNFGWSN